MVCTNAREDPSSTFICLFTELTLVFPVEISWEFRFVLLCCSQVEEEAKKGQKAHNVTQKNKK